MSDGGPGQRVIMISPQGQALAYRLGGEGLLVLVDLIAHGEPMAGGVMITVGYRAIARRVGLSKDTVGRRMATLVRHGVVVRVGSAADVDGFSTPTYEVRLATAGIEVQDQLLPDRSS
jgi:hypothetical protein